MSVDKWLNMEIASTCFMSEEKLPYSGGKKLHKTSLKMRISVEKREITERRTWSGFSEVHDPQRKHWVHIPNHRTKCFPSSKSHSFPCSEVLKVWGWMFAMFTYGCLLAFPPEPRYVNASHWSVSLLYHHIRFGFPNLVPSFFGPLQPQPHEAPEWCTALNKSVIIKIKESADNYEAIL